MSEPKVLTSAFVLTAMLFLICYANTTEAQLVEDGLVSYWSLDESSIDGDTVKDLQNDNDGTINGAPKIVAGKLGEALEFNGADTWIEVPNADNLNFGDGDFTLCAWAKTTATTGRWASRHDIVGKGDPSISGYALSADNNNGFFWIGGEGEFRSASTINDGKWHYLVGVRKGSDVTLYIDATAETTGTSAESTDTTLSFIFAKHPLKAESYFAGSIDEVCVYNRALSEDEVKQNYEAKAAAVNPSGKLSIVWSDMKSE